MHQQPPGGWPVRPKKPGPSPLLLIPIAIGAACIVGAVVATVHRDDSPQSRAPQTVEPRFSSQSQLPAPSQEYVLRSATCANNDEIQSALRIALSSNAAVFRCVLLDGQEALRLPVGRDGVRAPTALALIYHRLLETVSAPERSAELARQRGFARGHENWRSHVVAMANPTESQRRHGLVDGVVTAAAPINGVTAYQLLLSDGASLAVVYPRIDSSFSPRGTRVRMYGVWGEKDGTAALFSYWVESL